MIDIELFLKWFNIIKWMLKKINRITYKSNSVKFSNLVGNMNGRLL